MVIIYTILADIVDAMRADTYIPIYIYVESELEFKNLCNGVAIRSSRAFIEA